MRGYLVSASPFRRINPAGKAPPAGLVEVRTIFPSSCIAMASVNKAASGLIEKPLSAEPSGFKETKPGHGLPLTEVNRGPAARILPSGLRITEVIEGSDAENPASKASSIAPLGPKRAIAT